jgi:hypothetical protein
MPTVKLQNGKVLLKDGKVSCSCCEEGCCMYPADKLGDTYEAADLPDAVTINGVSSDKYPTGGIPDLMDGGTPGYWKGGTPQTGDYCISEFGSGVWSLFIYDEDEWDASGGLPCLIGGDDRFNTGNDEIEDQFADCYGVDSSYAGLIILRRQSLCVWTGEDICGREVLLFYCQGDGETPPNCIPTEIHKWHLYYTGYFSNPVEFGCEENFPFDEGFAGVKSSPQNKPDGTYINQLSGGNASETVTEITCP